MGEKANITEKEDLKTKLRQFSIKHQPRSRKADLSEEQKRLLERSKRMTESSSSDRIREEEWSSWTETGMGGS